MKKLITVLILIMVIFSHGVIAEAAIEESEAGPWKRIGYVFFRGIASLAGSPLEIPRTMGLEIKNHPKAWPFTILTRVPMNLFIRGTSSINDVLFFPPVAPFSNDLSSWSEHMGLPEYPWQWNEDDLN